jgi:hypothetical protein
MLGFALCVTVLFVLPSMSTAQTSFYNDSSCTVLCDGNNCGGVKFSNNPSPSSVQVGDCYVPRTDQMQSSQAVTSRTLSVNHHEATYDTLLIIFAEHMQRISDNWTQLLSIDELHW